MVITILKGLELTCYMRESCTAADVGHVNHFVGLVMSESHHLPTCDYIPIFSEWASCMLKKTKKLRAKKKRSSVVAHKDNISILVPSSNDLVPMYHRTSALDHYRRSTADNAYTTRGCSPEADN
jgi:hypothetical protein